MKKAIPLHSLSKGSATAGGGRDKEERSLRKLIETAKEIQGKGCRSKTDDHQFQI